MTKTTSTNATAAEPKNPPVARLRIGLINASIWQRSTEKAAFYSVSFERRYKDAEGNWQSSHSFNADDLLVLSKLADQAHTEITRIRNGDDE